MTKLQDQFYKLAEGFATREGFAAIAWESFKRLAPKDQQSVIRAMDDDFDNTEDESFIENLAELLR